MCNNNFKYSSKSDRRAGRPGATRTAPGWGVDGFSLVELLVSIALLILIVPALTFVEINSIKANTRADELTMVTAFAVSKAEELQAMPYNDIAAGEEDHLLPNGLTVGIHWTVDRDSPEKGMKTVTIKAAREPIRVLKTRVAPPVEIVVYVWENA